MSFLISVNADSDDTETISSTLHIPSTLNVLDAENDVSDDADECHFHEIISCEMSRSQFENSLKKLTSCQRKAFLHIKDHFMNRGTKPLRIVITGGAGVGKSFVLKIICSFLQLFCAVCTGTNPVKCCAPTGPAARNINGQTIYSALKIPVDKYLNYASLTAYQLRMLKNSFAGSTQLLLMKLVW